jgi:hypothetical protein
MIGVNLWTVVGLIEQFYRNGESLIKAIYVVPPWIGLAGVSGLLLWKQFTPDRALRIICWFIIGLAELGIPVTLIDALRWNDGFPPNHDSHTPLPPKQPPRPRHTTPPL